MNKKLLCAALLGVACALAQAAAPRRTSMTAGT